MNATEPRQNQTKPYQHGTPRSGSPLPARFDWGVVCATSLIHLQTTTATCTTGEKLMAYRMDKEMLKLIVELWGEDSIQAEFYEV